jgi:hypothetical protein
MTEAFGLEAVLDQLHHCILTADFVLLPKILEETERQLEHLHPLSDRTVLERLKYKADRNGRCLQAASRGLRAAQRRLGEVSTTDKQLSTYTKTGKRSEVAVMPGAMAKRL